METTTVAQPLETTPLTKRKLPVASIILTAFAMLAALYTAIMTLRLKTIANLLDILLVPTAVTLILVGCILSKTKIGPFLCGGGNILFALTAFLAAIFRIVNIVQYSYSMGMVQVLLFVLFALFNLGEALASLVIALGCFLSGKKIGRLLLVIGGILLILLTAGMYLLTTGVNVFVYGNHHIGFLLKSVIEFFMGSSLYIGAAMILYNPVPKQ